MVLKETVGAVDDEDVAKYSSMAAISVDENRAISPLEIVTVDDADGETSVMGVEVELITIPLADPPREDTTL